MILLAFLLPLAVYFLILGSLNNQEHPVMVPGPWDFAGVLLAASGFLLLGGPAILANFNEQARMYWMLGEGKGPAGAAEGSSWLAWMLLSILYLAVVVSGAAILLWRHRRFTSIYNAERSVVERALLQACVQAGVDPVRSADMFLFGLAGEWSNLRRGGIEGIQAPHYRPLATKVDGEAGRTTSTTIEDAFAQSAVLEIDSFPWLRHVTLRWDPADAPLRSEIEGGLRRLLKQTPASDATIGFWMTLTGQLLFVLIFLGVLAVFIMRLRMWW